MADIHASAWIHPTALLFGDVTIGEHSSVWPYAVFRGDYNTIRVGAWSNIQDACVIHTAQTPTVIGDYVSVAHGAVLHACTVADLCLIGIHATVMDGAVIGEGSLIGAHTLVREGTVIPPNSVVVGVPGKVIKTTSGNRKYIRGNAQSYYELSQRYAAGTPRFPMDEVLLALQRYHDADGASTAPNDPPGTR